MKLFVTGASGYLGGALVRALLPHHQLRLLVRRPESIGDLLRAPGVEVVEGDLLTSRSWEGRLAGCDGVLHRRPRNDALVLPEALVTVKPIPIGDGVEGMEKRGVVLTMRAGLTLLGRIIEAIEDA